MLLCTTTLCRNIGSTEHQYVVNEITLNGLPWGPDTAIGVVVCERAPQAHHGAPRAFKPTQRLTPPDLIPSGSELERTLKQVIKGKCHDFTRSPHEAHGHTTAITHWHPQSYSLRSSSRGPPCRNPLGRAPPELPPRRALLSPYPRPPTRWTSWLSTTLSSGKANALNFQFVLRTCALSNGRTTRAPRLSSIWPQFPPLLTISKIDPISLRTKLTGTSSSSVVFSMGTGRCRRQGSVLGMDMMPTPAMPLNKSHLPPVMYTTKRWTGLGIFCE